MLSEDILLCTGSVLIVAWAYVKHIPGLLLTWATTFEGILYRKCMREKLKMVHIFKAFVVCILAIFSRVTNIL